MTWSTRMLTLVDGDVAAVLAPRHFKVHGRSLESAVRKLRKALLWTKKGKA